MEIFLAVFVLILLAAAYELLAKSQSGEEEED